MKLLNIISVCAFLFVGVAEVQAEAQDKGVSKNRITRSFSQIFSRNKTPLKIAKEQKINDADRSLIHDVGSDDDSRSSLSSNTSSKTGIDSWTSKSVSWKSWTSSDETSSKESSESSSDTSSHGTSDSTSHGSSTSTSTKNEEPKPRIQYDYIDDAFIKHVIASKFRYVLVGTGWSESSLGKMNLNNQEKQKRAFALSYAQMIKIEKMGGRGRLIYLTMSPINHHYRRYLYRVGNKTNISRLKESAIELRFRNFEKHSLRSVYFSAKGRERNAADPTGYMSEKSNRYRQIQLPNALNALRNDLFTSNHFVGFTAHFSGPYLEEMAKTWDLPYLVNPSAQAHWIKKSKSRQSFRNAGVRHPRGTYEPSFSVDALVDDIYALLKQLDYKKIILKLDQSAAGYGNKVMKFDEIHDDLSEEDAKNLIRIRFDDREIFPAFFIGRIEEADGGAIVEEFIDCKNYASPASIYMINGLHDVNMRYTYDQLLGGKDKQVYEGSLGPIQVNQSYPPGDLIAMSRAVGMSLSEEGVFGNVGTDFVTCDADDSDNPNRDAWAIENNVRMTGTSYPYYTLMTLVGVDKIKKKFMKSFDDVKIPIIVDREFREKIQRDFYLSFLLKHPETLNIGTARGCLIHNDTFRLGKLGVACLADSRDEVSEMYDRFIADVYKFIDEHEATYNYRSFLKLNELEHIKVSIHTTRKILETLISPQDFPNKQFDILYESGLVLNENAHDYGQPFVGKAMRPETLDRDYQQRFFKEQVFYHPVYFNSDTGTGCMINNDVFKKKHLSMVCVWDQGVKPESYVSFFEGLKQQLFVDDENEQEENAMD